MPNAVLVQLRKLGEDLSVARKRRREPLKAWAQRIGVSEPKLVRMEKGIPLCPWRCMRGQGAGHAQAPLAVCWRNSGH